ncbi:MAG: transglutaminase domain-containing protein [Christensenellaceae bacterium]|nr:transglutaminase domain-containing protein [Christensenellaceae bacterium]
MQGKIKEAISHGVVAMLYALGLTLTLLHVLELTGQVWAVLPVAALLIAAMAASTVKRWAGWALAGVMTAVGALWLAMGGMSVVIEAFRGVTLHLSGVMAALPMVAGETAMLIAVMVAVISFLLTYRAAGAYPAMTVLLLALLLLWLGNRAELLLWLLPSVAAVMTLLALSTHESMSIRRVLPMMAAAAVAAFLVVPTGGVTVEPLKNAADTLRQKIFDYFFFTEPRDVFTLAAEGYYPQGQSQLGGPATPSDHAVMVVTTTGRTYLRGAIKNEYTGRAWLDTTGGRRYLWMGLRWQGVRSDTFDMALPTGLLGNESSLMRTTTISVRMLTDSMSSLFVPQRVRQLSPGGDLVPYFNVGSEIFVTRNLQPGDTWTVQAPLMQAGDAGLEILVNACAQTEDPAYEEIRRIYTALPEHLQQELYDLARRAVEGSTTPYQMAFALQNYLSRSYRYTLDVAPQPAELDFVTNFLLQTREGYCTYFASAMTVLCRMLGLPARYVEGYVAEPDAEGNALVTGMDAHAWTEVYFSGFGWLTFDATPRTGGGTSNSENPPEESAPPEDEPSPSPSPEPTETPTPEPDDEMSTIAPPQDTPTPEPSEGPSSSPSPEPSDEPEAPPEEPARGPRNPWWWLLLLLLLAIAGMALRVFLMLPAQAAARAKDEQGRWMAWTQALYDELRVMGYSRQPNESPMAFMERLDANAQLPVALYQLGQGEALTFYGRAEPQAEATFAVRQAYASLWAALNPRQKVMLTLRRSFLPKRKLDFTKN